MKPSAAQLGLGPVAIPGESAGEISSQPRWLTDAAADVLHRVRGTIEAVALTLRVPKHRVYGVADRHQPKPLPAWFIPTICRETSTFTLLDLLEAQCGRVAFLLPPVNPCVEEMNRELARLLQEFGSFLETNGTVLADGRLEPHEVPGMLRAIDDILAGMSEYRAMVVRKAATDGPPMAKAALR